MRVEKLLKQLKREFIKVKLIQSLLDGLVFFLVANMILFLLSLRLISGISNFKNILALAGVSLVFTIADLIYRSKKYNLEVYEEKNPELQEILRTARDNIDRQNIVSQALFDELLEKSRKVTSESIIPAKAIIWKTLLVGLLSFLTVMSGLADFQLLQDNRDLLSGEQLKDLIDQKDKGKDEVDLKNASDIYGEASDIDSSNIDINFNITGRGKAEEGDFNPTQGPPPDELVLDVSGQSLNEDLELAKKYSVEVKNIG